jgi:hypothetical protein
MGRREGKAAGSGRSFDGVGRIGYHAGMEGKETANVFAVLALVAAPAVLTNAMSVLALGSSNRVARVQDRLREMLRELGKSVPGSPEHESWLRQLGRLRKRARLLLNAMKGFFVALGSFAATTVLAIVGSGLDALDLQSSARGCAMAALGIGLFGVGNLLLGCLLVVRDTRLAVDNLEDELEAKGVPERR